MKKIVLLFLFLNFVVNASAKIELPEIIGDNMMLQQQSVVNIWGKAEPNTKIYIETSWNVNAETKSDADGRWIATLKTPKASYTPQSITISDGQKITINNILIGEVWFASGQSNMEMPLRGFWDCPIAKSNETIARAGAYKSKIRYATIEKTAAYTPQENVKGKWLECSVDNAPNFGATAYFFAKQLSDVLDVPIGIINCSWGGSRVESWINREKLETYKTENLTTSYLDTVQPEWMRPLVMFNGMLNPLTNYTIKGFIWYQGESNIGHDDVYAQRFADLITLWRNLWKQGDLPFYFVEIAPEFHGDIKGDWAALLREAQWKTIDLVPNCAAVCTNDLVEPYEEVQIHPKNKQDVGDRLAFLALNKTYGFKAIACESPQLKSVEMTDNRIYLSFTNADEGFSRMMDIQGFEICGADKVFYPADVKVEGNEKHRLIISSKQVAEPVAVRYCFRNFQIGNMANLRGLPIVPFRTDRN